MNTGRLGPALANFQRRLRDPLQLRIFLGGAVLLAWYLLVFSPLRDQIEAASKNRAEAERHFTLAREIDSLRAVSEDFKSRVPNQTDTNEWVEYLLAGVRNYPVKLIRLEPRGALRHGPLEVVILQVDLEGNFPDLDAVLAWVEKNPRLLRIDTLNIAPSNGRSGGLTLKMTVMGVAA